MLEKFQRLAASGDGNSQAVMALQLADLFISKTEDASTAEKRNFDFIIQHVTKTISRDVTVRLAERVARTHRLHSDTAVHLADNPDSDVAAPLLRHSPMLSDAKLIEIAKNRSENHRVAIAQRAEVAEGVTEVLSEVGGERTLSTLADNQGARFNSKGLSNMLERAAPNSSVPRKLAERANNDSNLAKTVRKSLGSELRRQLEDAGLDLSEANFEQIQDEAKQEVDRQVKAERLHMVDAMVARSKVANGQASMDQVVSDAIRKNAFLLGVRILAMHSSIPYDVFLLALSKERAEPLAILCRASGVELGTFEKFETMRCGYFEHPLGDVTEKVNEMRRVSQTQAQELLTNLQQTLAN
ncbi:MAG: DUF2336 domain-containing protein [Pseudomonadota bacterium]